MPYYDRLSRTNASCVLNLRRMDAGILARKLFAYASRKLVLLTLVSVERACLICSPLKYLP